VQVFSGRSSIAIDSYCTTGSRAPASCSAERL
jgi:hypothetical protein